MSQALESVNALKRFEKLIGTWELTGRPVGGDEDNIRGQVTIRWFGGGAFIEQRGQWDFMGFQMETMEIIGYDAATDTFPAYAYSGMGGLPMPYFWGIDGDTVTHWMEGSKYTGAFSEDGRLLIGGWRPDAGVEAHAGNNYDATMVRVG